MTAKNMLNSKDRELVLLNFSLIENLNRLLHSFQAQQQADQDLNKKTALGIARHSAEQMAFIVFISFIIIVLLLLLILYEMYRVNRQAKKLLTARLDAEKQTIAKSNLLASVSHEMRNPLTVIRGMTELLQDTRLPDAQNEQVKIINSASDMLLSTVNDILDFSKLEAKRMFIQPAPLQPVTLVEEVHAIMKSLAKQKGLVLLPETNGLAPGLTVQGDAFHDDPVVVQLTKLFLEKQEASVVVVEDGAHGWSLFKSDSFDMVITDINLPGISGIALAKNIRGLPDREKSQVPILALTGDAFELQTGAYKAAGINDTIIKPFNRNDFLEKVGRDFKISSHFSRIS